LGLKLTIEDIWENRMRAFIVGWTVLAAAIFASSAYAAHAGCDFKPGWLCYMNSTWWQGRSEDDAKKYILSHCRDTPREIICHDQGHITRIPKDTGPRIKWH
jgi:hypothetical protein